MRVRLIFILQFLLFAGHLRSQPVPYDPDAKLKAIFLYNFTRYFEWQPTDSRTFRFGMIGLNADSSLVLELRELAKRKKVVGQDIEVLTFRDAKEVTQTEVLYVNKAHSRNYRLPKNIRNTLVITDDGSDLYNTMISFMALDGKTKFAFNSYYTIKAGLRYSDDFKQLAAVVITNPKSNEEEKKSIEKWASAIDKMKSSVSRRSGGRLTKEEMQQVLEKIEEQSTILKDKENTLYNMSQDISEKEKSLTEQRARISQQEYAINAQKQRIDEQFKSLRSQGERLRLQEEKLKLTMEQNELQQEELTWKKLELSEQEKKIRVQRDVLRNQKKDINRQNRKLIRQMEQINTQQTILWLSAAVVACVIGGLVFIYWSLRKTRRLNIFLEKQKQQIEAKNALIMNQKQVVEEQHKEITDSINYAQRIQRALLTSEQLLRSRLGDVFIFFKPKDVVSGDFYWASEMSDGKFALVIADSTGHGVPGAIMSILNIAALREAIQKDGLTDPGDILNHARRSIVATLANDGSAEGGKDGMDGSLVCFDLPKLTINYAAAHNPVWLVRNGEVKELKADNMPVGKHDRDNVPFTSHSERLEKGDMVYLFTDGFADQFGGPKGKKFMYNNLKSLLASASVLSTTEQRARLDEAFTQWKGNLEQVDDVCVFGVRVVGTTG